MPKIELKIDNVMQDTPSDLGDSFLCAKGKGGSANQPQDIFLQLNMADDTNEVRGFGQPITPGLAKSIAIQYITKSNTAWDLIHKIDDGEISDIDEIKNSEGFTALKSLLDPENQIVSADIFQNCTGSPA